MNFRNMGIAFGIALFVSALCTLALGRKITASAAEKHSALHYVVPAKALQANQIVTADDVTMADWPSNDPVAGAFTKTQDVMGRALLYPVDKGQPLTEMVLSAPGAGIGLAAHIPDGMRAIALRSDDVVGVAGFLLPGTRVDVLATYRTPEPITVTVLQNVEVLAAGQKTQPDPDGKPETATVVTLLLKPEDAEKAVLASSQGSIHFVLRSGSDTRVLARDPVELSELTNLPGAAPASAPRVESVRHVAEAKPRQPKPRPATYSVQTVLGDKVVTNTFEVNEP